MNEKLIKEASAGSREAFCELYGQYKDKLYRYALYRLRDPDDAEDAVSDCVLAAWQGIGKLRSSEAFASWLFRILSNCCAKKIKEAVKARENIERIVSEGNGRIVTFRSDNVSPALSVELAEALSILSEEEREVVLFSCVGGLNSNEISELTGLTAGAVRSKLSRSLAKMRDFLS